MWHRYSMARRSLQSHKINGNGFSCQRYLSAVHKRMYTIIIIIVYENQNANPKLHALDTCREPASQLILCTINVYRCHRFLTVQPLILIEIEIENKQLAKRPNTHTHTKTVFSINCNRFLLECIAVEHHCSYHPSLHVCACFCRVLYAQNVLEPFYVPFG